jgi:DNA excision repair protein ERCC-6
MYEKFGMGKILREVQEMHDKRNSRDIVNVSSKTKFMFELLTKLHKEGHKVLIFSMSKQMLDLIELVIENDKQYEQDFKYLRIDGDTEIAEREGMCKKFNSSKDIFCCLLTTKVGGFGLNLTGADRAIILDPDWNPANDN